MITPQQLPKEAIKAELLVNLILTERNDKKELADFNEAFNFSARQLNLQEEKFDFQQIHKIRLQLNELLNRWKGLLVNELITLNW